MYNAATGHMCFAEALAYLKRQQPVARAAWIAGNYITLHKPGNQLVFIHPAGTFSWAPSSDDVLAEDWVPVILANTQ